MAQTTVEFKGIHGIIALVAVVLLVLIRLATLGDSRDPALRAAITAELRNELGNNLGKALEDFDSRDPDSVRRLTELADAEGIEIHGARVSKPLLSFASKQDAIVRVDYSLPEEDRVQAYWRFEHSAIGGWRYRYRSSAMSYYLNFF